MRTFIYKRRDGMGWALGQPFFLNSRIEILFLRGVGQGRVR